jgi:hypothetical protein
VGGRWGGLDVISRGSCKSEASAERSRSFTTGARDPGGQVPLQEFSSSEIPAALLNSFRRLGARVRP